MMHPVMGGGYQDMLQPAQLLYFFCMHQDAPGLGSSIHKGNIYRLESEQGNRNEIDKALQWFQHRGTESYRKVEIRGGVMGDMGGPEQTAKMIHPVQPVVHEIFQNE